MTTICRIQDGTFLGSRHGATFHNLRVICELRISLNFCCLRFSTSSAVLIVSTLHGCQDLFDFSFLFADRGLDIGRTHLHLSHSVVLVILSLICVADALVYTQCGSLLAKRNLSHPACIQRTFGFLHELCLRELFMHMERPLTHLSLVSSELFRWQLSTVWFHAPKSARFGHETCRRFCRLWSRMLLELL